METAGFWYKKHWFAAIISCVCIKRSERLGCSVPAFKLNALSDQPCFCFVKNAFLLDFLYLQKLSNNLEVSVCFFVYMRIIV